MGTLSERAAEIVATLTQTQKITLLSGRDFWSTEAFPDKGLDSIMVADGPHGLRKQGEDADHIGMGDSFEATCFPTAVAMGSTWDPDLIRRVGAAVGREALAEDLAVVLGPGLNIKRHPGGGRNFEYFSEDPLISGVMAAALTEGIQSQGVGACLKHYAVNNQEKDRLRVDAVLDERTLREIYLTGFEIAVERANPWTIMCAYNKINGTHASHHARLLNDVLRGEWGFDGLVVSDWYAVSDRAAGVAGGLDLEMPGTFGCWDKQVARALASGDLPEAALDTACGRIVELVLKAADARAAAIARQGLSEGAIDHEHDAHHALAREVAAAGSVLVSNDGILPLRAEGTIAVIGAFAKIPRYQGAGSSQVNPTRLEEPLDAILERREGATVTYARGYDPISGETTQELIEEARGVAAAADVVVLVVGLPPSYESEGYDSAHPHMPEAMGELVDVALAANDDVVVVFVGGSPVEVPWADRPRALLLAYLGGQAGGAAMADVLFGDVDPGGRLAESWPVRVEDLPSHANFSNHPTQIEHRENLYVGYRFHDSFGVPARFAFGHGLSYATFELGEPVISGQGRARTLSVPVTNTSERAGSTVVQVYVHDVASSVHRPEQELRGFAKIALGPGESGAVEIELGERAFAVYDVASASWRIEAGEFELRVGTSSVDIAHTVTVTIDSDDVVTPVPGPMGSVATDAEFEVLLGRPIPEPIPLLPYNRETVVRDLDATGTGRLFRSIVRWEAGRRLQDASEDATMDSFVEFMPMRLIAMGSEGALSLGTIDTIIKALNATTWVGRRKG
jgi:beta-glucosidase